MTQHGTGISWTHVPGYKGETWNPVVGCTRVSAGCDHCYAFTLHDQRYKTNRDHARKFGHGASAAAYRALPIEHPTDGRPPLPFPAQYDRPFSQVQLLPDRLDQPLHWRKPRAVFVDSMSDLFHDGVPDAYLDRVFATMALTPQHIYFVLTKRPERMREYVHSHADGLGWVGAAATLRPDWTPDELPWPLPNVWLGVSVEDQATLDERVPILLDTPAAVRGVSLEPLLGPVDLEPWLPTPATRDVPEDFRAARALLPMLDWVIVGGESGPGWRPMEHEWVASIRDQCAAAGVAFYGKQGAGARSGIALPSPLNEQAWPEVTT